MDLLERISKKALGLKGIIEADNVKQELIHNSVHNSVS